MQQQSLTSCVFHTMRCSRPEATFPAHWQSVISLGYSTSEDDEETQLNGASPPLPPDDEGGIPHRWRVVIMMAAAFVLCNMDKVRLIIRTKY